MGLDINILVDGQVDAELSQPQSAEVVEQMDVAASYQLVYGINIAQDDLPLLSDSRLDAGSQLSIVAPGGGVTHTLVKGPVTGQSIHLKHSGDNSNLIVQGADNSIGMDRETKSAIWDGQVDSDVVNSIITEYQLTGDIETTPAYHDENKHALVQRDSDLRFIRRLARRNGFLFWVDVDESGTEKAHFKRPALDAGAGPDVIINLDGNNTSQLDIQWNAERPTSVVGSQLNLNDQEPIPGELDTSPLTTLGQTGIGQIATGTRSVHLAVPVDEQGDLQARAEGMLIEAGWFIKAECTTSVHQLGRIIRAHSVVNLRGAGTRHSGYYYVSKVRHNITQDSHQMELTLIRNGWG